MLLYLIDMASYYILTQHELVVLFFEQLNVHTEMHAVITCAV